MRIYFECDDTLISDLANEIDCWFYDVEVNYIKVENVTINEIYMSGSSNEIFFYLTAYITTDKVACSYEVEIVNNCYGEYQILHMTKKG